MAARGWVWVASTFVLACGEGPSASIVDAAMAPRDAAPEQGDDRTVDRGGSAQTPPAPRCGDGIVQGGEECDDGANGERFDGCLADCKQWLEPLGEPLPAARVPYLWEYIEIEGARCRNGRPAGFGLSRAPGARKLLIYLEGGGACFNELCNFTAFDVPFIPPIDGIFDRLNPNNPVRDWNMVYVPYCTGDVHAGDASDTVIQTPLGPVVNHFVGYRNIGLYLERLVPTFRSSEQVLLTGISAGGFGAGLNAERTQLAFGPVPVVLIDDSGPPMSTSAMPPCLQRKFRETWNFDETILALCGADCPDPDDYVLDYFRHLQSVRGDRPGGLISNTRDLVIRTFYGFGENGCRGGVVPSAVYRRELAELRADIEDRGANFGTYYVDGSGHTFLRTPGFYFARVGRSRLSDWVGAVLDGRPRHVGP